MESKQTITLAGEILTEADWPVGCRGFEFIKAYDPARSRWFLKIRDDLGGINIYFGYETREFQDRTRCWFLDKAEEAERERMRILSIQSNIEKDARDWRAWEGLAKAEADYLASAAKWARIGKGAK